MDWVREKQEYILKEKISKVYMIKDDENVLLSVVKSESRSKAIYETFKHWKNDFGIDDIKEFNKLITCIRYKSLDDLNFYYFDGRDSTEEYEFGTEEILRKEIKNTIKTKW